MKCEITRWMQSEYYSSCSNKYCRNSSACSNIAEIKIGKLGFNVKFCDKCRKKLKYIEQENVGKGAPNNRRRTLGGKK